MGRDGNATLQAAERAMSLSRRLSQIDFEQISGWANDDHVAALSCFRLSARRMAERPYTTKALGIDAAALADAGETALRLDPDRLGDRQAARAFFEHNFQPFLIEPAGQSGFVTGYYEPEVAASPVRTARFTYPLYRRPDDLVDINEHNRPSGWDSSLRFGRRTSAGIVPYFDRAQIEAGALAGRGLELAWLESPVEGFFIHIQGSARLLMPDGATMRVGYAGKSGQHYTAIGKVLVEAGEMRIEDVSMASIRDWLIAHPDQAMAVMAENRSFIFFAPMPDSDPALGPVAAASVPLTPGRSLAIDHTLHTFGTPIWVAVDGGLPMQSQPFLRLMVAQDTGSAIVGPARGDLFIGSGAEAGEFAGAIRNAAEFVALVPKGQLR